MPDAISISRSAFLGKGPPPDVIVTDYVPLTPMDAGNINGHVLFGMTGRSVRTTICNGKVLMKDRVLVGIDEEKILSEVREESKKALEEHQRLKIANGGGMKKWATE